MKLTERERQVLQQIVLGNGNKEIARALNIAYDTTRTHVQRVLLKTGARNRTHAAAIAVREGLA